MTSDTSSSTSNRRAKVRLAAGLAGLGVAANLLTSDNASGLITLGDLATHATRQLSVALEQMATSRMWDMDELDEERAGRINAAIMEEMENDMLKQQVMFRPPLEEEYYEIMGVEPNKAKKSDMSGIVGGIVNTLRGAGGGGSSKNEESKRTLSESRLQSLRRLRELRELSIDLGNGDCQWTLPTLITDTDADDVEATWLAAYPGSGKRLTSKMVEALTGHQVGDDWDHSVLGSNYGQVPMIKGQYPQHEQFSWWWYATTDQTILQLRNPRWALPSYRSMKNELEYQSTWAAVHQRVPRTYTQRTSMESWESFTDRIYYFKLLVRQWAWQIDFYMERGMRRVWYTGELIKSGPFGNETTWNGRCKNPRYPNNRLECHPVAITTYERLKDPITGPDEMAKIAMAMQGKNGFEVIGNETWPCIWSAVMDDNPNAKRNGKGPGWNQYSMNSTHLLMIMNETQYIIDKYSSAEWADDPIAPQLVADVSEYHSENAAELATVLSRENNCSPNPCQNGAVCEDGQSEYFFYYSQRCVCPQGWTGQFCEIDIDECENSACLNGAICVDNIPSIGGYTCQCAEGWSGNLCQTNTDDCQNAPCQNGATCVDELNGYTCECAPGFNGANCQIDINECQNAPCLNGGTCIDGVNGFSCNCAPGFLGPTCETEIVA